MKVQMLPVKSITPYWRNPRDNEEAVAAVKASIEQFGFNVPLVLDREHVLITGHTRLKAVQSLGWTEVPCVVVDLDAKKAKQYRIADNKTSEIGTWNADLLLAELRELGTEGMEVFFPSLDLEDWLTSTDASVDLPTNEQVDTAGGRMQEMANSTAAKANDQLIDVVCPDCAHTFSVAAHDLIAEAKKMAKDRESDAKEAAEGASAVST